MNPVTYLAINPNYNTYGNTVGACKYLYFYEIVQ